jgi:hypothetical protein
VTVEWGGGSALERGRYVSVAPGEAVHSIDFRLTHGAVITGRVTDGQGRPVTRASVDVAVFRRHGAGRTLYPLMQHFAMTDDRGIYRVFGLAEGRYLVRVHGGDECTPVSDGESRRFCAPVYYPGVPDAGAAREVTVVKGGQAAKIDIALVAATARVQSLAGTIARSDGRQANASVMVLQEAGRGVMLPAWGSGSARVQPGGRFMLDSVAPGAYRLLVTSIATDARNAVGRESLEVAYQPLRIPHDAVPIRVTTTPGSRAAGRVVFAPGSRRPPEPGGLRVEALSLDVPLPYPVPSIATVRGDGTFVLEGLVAARVFRPVVPAGWMVESVRLAGRDIAEEPLDFDGRQEVDGVEIVVTDRVTRVEARTASAWHFTAIVFPSDQGRWSAADHRLYPTVGGVVTGRESGFRLLRGLRVAAPDQHGVATIEAIPPGAYMGIAVAGIDDGAWIDAQQLRVLATLAQRFEVRPGETVRVRLPIAWR